MQNERRISQRLVEPDALGAVAALIRTHHLGSRLLLICDDATWTAAGQLLHQWLGTEFEIMPHSLGRAPRALYSHIEPILVSASAHHATGILAVGSGTVNDVAKLAAQQLAIPYICVATAASMNGYSSATSSLEVDGHKRSFPAAPPCVVVADLRVIAAAPRRLARAGLGDTLCRSTVAADRYLSHLVFGTPFERDIFEKLRAHEPWLMGNIALLKEGALDYMRHLMYALLDAGDAMNETGSSVVASQGEHIVAHTLDLMYGNELRAQYHGEMIAVTTSSMAQLQHKMLLSQPVLRAMPQPLSAFQRLFGKKLAQPLCDAYSRKVLDAAHIEEISARFTRHWPEIKAELLAMVVPANGIERAYKESGLATQPTGIGLNEDRYRSALSYAYLTRDRFTFLDLAAMNARRVS